jgi:hypothetical protein
MDLQTKAMEGTASIFQLLFLLEDYQIFEKSAEGQTLKATSEFHL